jgi:hypothetical protein
MFFDAIRQGDAAQVSPGLGLACFFGHTEIARRLPDEGTDKNPRLRKSGAIGLLHA